MRMPLVGALLGAFLASGSRDMCMAWSDMGTTERGEFTYQPPVGGKKPDPKPWRAVVGKKVQAEGIAWGSVEKGWGEYVLMNGARVYVEKADFLERGAYGKLIRVSGILTAERIPLQQRGAGRDRDELTIYKIAPARWIEIERVEWPWLQEVP